MANTTITNLPTATALTGTEQLNVVQSNASVSATVAQVGAYVNSNYPAPGISSVATSAPITGGTITSTGTIGLQSAGVTNAYLANMNAYTVKANITSGSAVPTDATVTSVLDTLGSTQGMTLYRGPSSWAALPGSGTNTLLSLSGSTSNPAWQTLSYMIDNAIGSASAQGTLLYRGASSWSALPPGLSGQLLRTGGASADPSWYTVTGAGTVTSVNASGGTTGMTFTGGPVTVSGTLTMSGTLATANGGTGLTTFTSGGAVYATSTSALTTGTLPIASGGTNSTAAATAGGIGYGTGTAHAYTAAGTTGQVLTSNGAGAPTWAAAASTGVTSVAQTFTGGIVSVSGSPITTTGTLALTVAGTSGGIPYFSSGTTWATSAALTQYGVVYGGGAGAAPVSTAAGTAGYALIANSAAAPTFQQVSLTAGVTGTLPVANGGTGVTASSGANSVVLRDANSNVTANSIFEGFTTVAAAGTTTTLTAASTPTYVVTGSGGQTYRLPDATTLPAGAIFSFNNNQTSGTVVVQNSAGTTLVTLQSGAFVDVTLLVNSPAAGTWDTHAQAPSNVSWSTNTLDWAGSITSSTWNGVAVAANRGGTGVANNVASTLTFSGAFGTTFTVTGTTSVTLPTSGTLATTSNTVASFSGGSTGLTPSTATTGAVTLAGTLGVANGGTGAATLAANNVLLGNGTSALQVVAPGTTGNVLTSNGTTWTSSTPAASGPTKAQAIAYSMILGF